MLLLKDPVDRMYSQFVHDIKYYKPEEFVLKDMAIRFDKKAQEQLELWENSTLNDGLKQSVGK